MTTDVEKAEHTLAALQSKREDWIKRGTELADERSSVAFNAHACGDQKSRAKLDKLNTEIATHASELASLDSAIAEANIRLATAKADAALAEDRAKAEQLADTLSEFMQHAADIDMALATAVESSIKLEQALIKMNALGASSPNRNQLETIGELALHTALMRTPWARAFRHLPPNQRRTFSRNGRAMARHRRQQYRISSRTK
jgi:hypothetical protein